MANTILITANWHTGALSQQTISRQYDNNRYVVQFVGYPEASEGNELDYYLLVWMSSAPGERPDEIAPIQLASDQWYISNVFTQQTQQIKFQMCALNTEGTFEAHSPIFTGFVRNSLEHDGTTQDIDVSTLFDAYREYLNELIIRAGAVVIDSVPTQGSTNAVQSGGVYSALAIKVVKPLTNPNGTNGQLLRTLGNGQTEWTDFATPTSEQVGEAVENWLDDHPEATTTVQDGAITEAKLDARLRLLTNVDLNGVTYFENITLPVTQSYAEAVTYFNGYYYAVCRDYSVSPNTCFVAKYDTSYNLIDTVYTSPTYGMANSIFNDGERIYIDFDSGYHVSFNASISDDFAVQNTAIRNFAYWNNTLYGIAINTNNVTVYTVASDFVTAEEVFTVVTQRYTLQSASIIDGILYIPTTKGLFKFIDMQTQRVIAEIPYYDSKEIENFFKDKDGIVKCSGHFYGANGIFNIGIFNGGVDGAKMQYTNIDGTDGDYSAFASSSQRYGFYKISNGTAMGLPVDTGDLLLFEDARLFVSKTSNTIYAYSNNAWNLIGFLSGKRVAVKVNNNYILFDIGTDGRLTIRCDYLPITQAVTEVNVDLSSLYSALGFADNQSFTIYITGSTNSGNIAASTSEVYVAQIYIGKTQTNIYTRNVTQNTTENINAKFSFFETLR